MKNIFISTFIVVLSLILITCSKSDDDVTPNTPPPTVKYSLNVSITPDNSGTVSPSSGSFEKGSSIKITGTPSSGYIFKEWKLICYLLKNSYFLDFFFSFIDYKIRDTSSLSIES